VNPFGNSKKVSPKIAEFLGKVLGAEERARYEAMIGEEKDAIVSFVHEGLSADEQRVMVQERRREGEFF